jgi:large subunit ribosomal protein L35
MPNRPERRKAPPPTPEGIREMPKMKSKSSAKKRFRLTASGKVRANAGYRRHMMINKPKKMKRQSKGTFILSSADARVIKKFLHG